MYLSKPNLTVVGVASTDAKRGALFGLHIAEDGTTVASNGKVMLAVSPTDPSRVQMPDVGKRESLNSEGITVPVELVEQTLRNMPKRPEMQYAIMTERVQDDKVELTTVDMTKEQRVASYPKRERFPEWKSIFRKAWKRADRTRVCLNRKTLLDLLKVLEQACPDPTGDNAIFVELGRQEDQVILRSINYATGQRAIAMLVPMDTHGQWSQLTDWEKGVLKAPSREPMVRRESPDQVSSRKVKAKPKRKIKRKAFKRK